MKQQVRTTLDAWSIKWLTATAERRGCSVSAVLRGLVEGAAADTERSARGVDGDDDAARGLILRMAEELRKHNAGEL